MKRPEDFRQNGIIPVVPVAELILKLAYPQIKVTDSIQKAIAEAELIYFPADGSGSLGSHQYHFISPLGPIELDEIRWYIERYYQWPTGIFRERANKTEDTLPKWGRALFRAIVCNESAHDTLKAWQQSAQNHKNLSHRFSVQVFREPSTGIDEKECALAASYLMSLPWEILHDGDGYLSQSDNGVQVRRQLPNLKQINTSQTQLPIRVLLLSPRPEVDEYGNSVGYIDHRVSAQALVQTMEDLGEPLLQVDILSPATFSALKATLKKARDNNNPYEIVHFDGHGLYDQRIGMGALCFEDSRDGKKVGRRRLRVVYANELATELRAFKVRMVYLDACQTAQAKNDPKASVAASLLEEGVASVVAMSHSVLVETARRFVEPFYQALAEGKRVGDAVLSGQTALHDDTYRFKKTGTGDLCLQDWFVPVLYQGEMDDQFFTARLGAIATRIEKKRQQPQLGALPEPPEHGFTGRSRTLLQLERWIEQECYVVIRGIGGMGKTVLAVELTRWLVRSGRFRQAVFVNVEPQNVQDVTGVLDKIGRQLVPNYMVNGTDLRDGKKLEKGCKV